MYLDYFCPISRMQSRQTYPLLAERRPFQHYRHCPSSLQDRKVPAVELELALIRPVRAVSYTSL